MLISHAHLDHLDLPSLERPGRRPAGGGAAAGSARAAAAAASATSWRSGRRGRGLRSARRLCAATAATTSGKRLPFGPRGGTGRLRRVGLSRVYFAGDTDMFAGMAAMEPDAPVKPFRSSVATSSRTT